MKALLEAPVCQYECLLEDDGQVYYCASSEDVIFTGELYLCWKHRSYERYDHSDWMD